MYNLIVGGYFFEKRLGKGSFGEVWRTSNGGKWYAIKMMNAADHTAHIEQMFANRNVILPHPFLVTYYTSFRFNDNICIVMEYCEGGDLRVLLNTLNKAKGVGLTTQRMMKIFIQMVLGLNELHHRNILHRDIKPENCFCNRNDDVKIGDFGTVRMLGSPANKAVTFAGTLQYMCPELFQSLPYDASSDIWSLGVMLYEMCMCEPPFFHPNQLQLGPIITAGIFKPIPKYTLPDEIITAIHSMLSVDPKKRPSTQDLLRLPVVIEFATSLGLLRYFPPANKGIPQNPVPPSSGLGVSVASPHPSPPGGNPDGVVITDERLIADIIETTATAHPNCPRADFVREFQSTVGRAPTEAEVAHFLAAQKKKIAAVSAVAPAAGAEVGGATGEKMPKKTPKTPSAHKAKKAVAKGNKGTVTAGEGGAEEIPVGAESGMKKPKPKVDATAAGEAGGVGGAPPLSRSSEGAPRSAGPGDGGAGGEGGGSGGEGESEGGTSGGVVVERGAGLGDEPGVVGGGDGVGERERSPAPVPVSRPVVVHGGPGVAPPPVPLRQHTPPGPHGPGLPPPYPPHNQQQQPPPPPQYVGGPGGVAMYAPMPIPEYAATGGPGMMMYGPPPHGGYGAPPGMEMGMMVGMAPGMYPQEFVQEYVEFVPPGVEYVPMPGDEIYTQVPGHWGTRAPKHARPQHGSPHKHPRMRPGPGKY